MSTLCDSTLYNSCDLLVDELRLNAQLGFGKVKPMLEVLLQLIRKHSLPAGRCSWGGGSGMSQDRHK